MADRLAAMAEQHYKTYLPRAYAAIPASKRAQVFEDLAEQANQQIAELEDDLAGPDQPGEAFQARLGRMTEARQAAEAQVLRELILPTPEAEETPAATPAETQWDRALQEWSAALETADEETAER